MAISKEHHVARRGGCVEGRELITTHWPIVARPSKRVYSVPRMAADCINLFPLGSMTT
jgi:hypothetical protein